jgi:serine/threonine protein kinase/truncated hemoglobin YjbI
MIDRTISHYRIVEKLGDGAMGVVYKAEDTDLGRFVALKFLSEEIASDAKALERMRREACAAAALNHPNICTIYEMNSSGDQFFIAMEYLEGMTLRRRITAELLDIESLLSFGIEIAAGLTAAHLKGVVHRDIKPANIFLTTSGQVKIVDFGLAKVCTGRTPSGNTATLATQEVDPEHLTGPGVALGTLPYMSPEQLQGRCVDHRTDIFSMGAVLYEMATGRRPFLGETSMELGSSILRDTPEPMTELRPELPRGLQRIVDRCLSKQPTERYASAQELRDAVELLRRQVSSGSRRAMHDEVGEASIAVLPFTNMSADPENEFFADGLSEEIVNALTQFEELRVAARRSTIAFKGKHVDLRVVGERLNVRTVLEGSVHKSANRIRIYAQLINISDGYHLWSERYDRELRDVFEVQDDISRAIANRLKVDLFSLIGGRQTVLAASESFFRRIVADNSINHFFAGADLAHLFAHYNMFISALLGGPEPYTGQDMGAAHAHLYPQLNDSHFDAFLKHFRAALQEVGVRDDKAERVMRVLEGKRNVVLNRDSAIKLNERRTVHFLPRR